MKKLLLAVAALCAMSILPAFAEHEWTKVDNSTIENDLWTLNASWKDDGTLTLNGATPKDGSLTTLDVSEMNIGGKALNSINSWQNSKIQTVKKLIIPYTMNNFSTEVNALPALEEICTPDGGHELSIGSWGKTIVNTSKLAGDYVIKDVTTLGSQNQGGIMSCYDLTSLEFRGSYATISASAAFLNCGLKSISFNTTGAITTIPSQLCGWYGNQEPSKVPSPFQLTSLTLNGKPMLRCADITQVGSQAMPHATLYADIVDLPNCTSVGEYAFRYDESIPFINLMSVTSLGQYCFGSCDRLSRVVFGAKQFTGTIATDILSGESFTSSADASVIWNCTSRPSFNGPCYRDVDKSKKEIKNYVRKEAGWLVENWGSRPYVKQDEAGQWCLYDWNDKTVRQPLVAMDTAFKVNLRLNGEPVMATLMPGVSGQDATWTIPAGWFLLPGQTFGEGSVKDAKGDLVDVATVKPDGSGLNLTITLPASLVQSADDVTQDVELYVDMIAKENKNPQIAVKIADEEGVTIVSDQLEATVGTSVEKDYSSDIFEGGTYFYSRVISTVVDPDSALNATLDLTGKLLLEAIAKDADVTIVINRKLRPVQQDHWTLSADKLSMTDGLWTFRCDFTDGKAVVANASGYAGSETECSTVDFSKPVFDDQAQSYSIKSLNWGATVGGTEIDVTKSVNHYGKDIVIEGGGIPRTLIGCVKLPTTPLELFAGWGGCESMTNAASDFAVVTNLGAYALCDTQVSGGLSFPPEVAVNIGNYAFYDCKKLTSIAVPGLYSRVGTSAFQGANKLESADLSGVVFIGPNAFNQVSVLKVVLCPVLQSFKESVFSRPANGLQLSVAQPTDEMRKLPAIDGIIEREAFRDYRGTHAITIPFRGRVTQTAVNSFKWLGPCTNIVFWGKAPAEGTFTKDAITEQGASQSYTRRITASKAMDEEGWIAWATPCTAEEKARADYPGDGVCFGTYDVNGAKFWMCWGKSPWEKGGMILIIR